MLRSAHPLHPGPGRFPSGVASLASLFFGQTLSSDCPSKSQSEKAGGQAVFSHLS